MDAGTMVEKIEKRFTLEDVTSKQVETVSVVALDELETLIGNAIEEGTAGLKLELQQAKEQLANAQDGDGGGGGGDLERAAAEAAMEAEERALEGKAQAEQRAAEAESKVTKLEAELAAAEGAPKEDPAKVKELEDKVAALQAQAAELQKEIDKLKSEAGGDDDDDSPVTDDERKKAQRLATAFLEDVFSDDEDETNKALKDGKFRDKFAKELKGAHRKYVKRVRAAVRADGDIWEDVLKECEGKEW